MVCACLRAQTAEHALGAKRVFHARALQVKIAAEAHPMTLQYARPAPLEEEKSDGLWSLGSRILACLAT
jgi:hypothetical protein